MTDEFVVVNKVDLTSIADTVRFTTGSTDNIAATNLSSAVNSAMSLADCYRDGVVMTKEHPSLSIKATAEEFSDENNPLFEVSYSGSLSPGSKVNYSLNVDPTTNYLYFNRNDYDTNTFQKGTGLTPAALFAADDTSAAGHKRAFYQASGIIYRLNNRAFFNLAVDDSAKEVALETALNYKLTFKDNNSQISLTDIIDKLNSVKKAFTYYRESADIDNDREIFFVDKTMFDKIVACNNNNEDYPVIGIVDSKTYFTPTSIVIHTKADGTVGNGITLNTVEKTYYIFDTIENATNYANR